MTIVEVPVQVIDDGAPVRGLTQIDFVLRVDGERQRISGFDVVDLSVTDRVSAKPAETPPLAARRHFLFFFDLSFSEPAALVRSRHAALDVLDDLHPTDLVAVATYTLMGGPELVLGFTTDRDEIETAVETLGLPQLVERSTDPLGFVVGDPLGWEGGADSTEAGDGEASGGRFGDAADRHLADLAIGLRRQERESIQSRIMAMTQGFAALGKALDSVEGRKHVVLFSPGVDTSILTGTADRDRTRYMNEASIYGQYWAIDSEERYGSTASLSAFQQMARAFLRSDASIQAVDIGTLDRDVDARGRTKQESLYIMAEETGGELYANFTDLGEAMAQLLDRTSVTYVLSFQPSELGEPGEYHELDVDLADGPRVPRAARVVHRPGFYSPLPYEDRAPIERQLDSASLILSGTEGGTLDSAVLATPFPIDRDDGDRAYVPVLIEIDGRQLLDLATEGRLRLDLYGYGMDSSGGVRDLFSQRLDLDLAKVEPALRQRGLKFFGALYLPPGEHTVRTLVRTQDSGAYGLRVTAVDVPDFDTGEPALSTPLFPEPPGTWLLVREAGADESERGVDYPFTLAAASADMERRVYVPTVRPTVDDEATVVLAVHGLGGAEIQLAAELRDAAGQSVSGARFGQVERIRTSDSEMEQLVSLLDTTGVPPGEYRLVVQLTEKEYGETLTSSIPVVVAD